MTKESKLDYTSVVIDTLNQLQDDLYFELLERKGKAQFDDWKDFGVEVYQLIRFIRDLGAIPVLVLGFEGTGKTYAVQNLDPEETLYLNTDRKPLTFPGAAKEYTPEKKNYDEPIGYNVVKKRIKHAWDNKKTNTLVVFIMGHIESYTDVEGSKRWRLRVLGKMATKHNLEGQTVHTYYTHFDPDEPERQDRYKLRPHNAGYDTARSPGGYFDEEDLIAPDLKIILDKILEEHG